MYNNYFTYICSVHTCCSLRGGAYAKAATNNKGGESHAHTLSTLKWTDNDYINVIYVFKLASKNYHSI